MSSSENITPSKYVQPQTLMCYFHSQYLPQDILAIAAARRRGVYPYDVLVSEDNSSPISLPAVTPKTPHSAISDICTLLGISDLSRDHAGSLWIVYCNAVSNSLKGVHIDSNSNYVAAACVYLADQSNKARLCPSCSIEIIASAVGCDASHLLRISSKLGPLLSAEYSKVIQAPLCLEFPIFYACVCDFGLSLVSCSILSIPPVAVLMNLFAAIQYVQRIKNRRR
jgi:hypothetical protein